MNFVVSVVMGVMVYPVGKLVVNTYLSLLLQIVVGVCSSVVINGIVRNPDLRYLLTLIKGFLNKKEDAGV